MQNIQKTCNFGIAKKALAIILSVSMMQVCNPALSFAQENETDEAVKANQIQVEAIESNEVDVIADDAAVEAEPSEPALDGSAEAVEIAAAPAAEEEAEEPAVEEAVKTYTMTWKDEDGTVLAQSEVAAGETPVYPNADPAKAEDANYTYTFAGWSPKVATATNDRNYRAVYEAVAKPAQADATLGEKAQIRVTNIMKAGAMNSTNVQTLTKGQTKTLTATGVLNLAGGKNYKASYYGVSYTFLNVYTLSTGKTVVWESATDGLTVSKLRNNGDGTMTATMSDGSTQTIDSNVVAVSPVYKAVKSWYLNYNYIDNVSTGSGSWQNEGAVSSFTHTFKTPESQPHYQFVNWEEEGTGNTYVAGDKFVYSNAAPKDDQVVVNTYAVWQPSVTVNYYNWDGKLLKSVERYEDIATADSFAAPTIEGAEFLGWFTGTQADASEAAATYEAPATTKHAVERCEYNVYARYSTSYTVQHALQNVEDDGYTMAADETETHENVLLGSNASAADKEFEGFSFNADAEGTLAQTVIDRAGIELKLFYDRDVYNVFYEYAGDVIPEGAQAQLPEAAAYKYGATVLAGKVPSVNDYTFSGWTGEVDTMPAADVTVTGSWTADEAPAAPAAAVTPVLPLANTTGTATGIAQVAPETISDNAAPLAAGHDVDCWVHWLMMLGMAMTAMYSFVVIGRRAKSERELEGIENEILGLEEADAAHAASSARPYGYRVPQMA